MMQSESNGSNKRENTQGSQKVELKNPQQPPPSSSLPPIFLIIKCTPLSEVFLLEKKDCILSNISPFFLFFFGRAAVEEVKVSAILSGKAQRLLHSSISNSLTGTHTNAHTLSHTHRIQNEAAAQNNLPDRLSDTKTHGQKGKTAIMRGWRGPAFIRCFMRRNTTTSFIPLKDSQTETLILVIFTRGCWPLCRPGVGSYNCRGRAAVFVSAVISKPWPGLFADTELPSGLSSGCSRGVFLVHISQNFNPRRYKRR